MATKKSSGGGSTKRSAPAEMMDPSVPEVAEGAPAVTVARDCYALATLKDEVSTLFPEVLIESGEPNGRGVGLSAEFDLSMLGDEDSILFNTLLGMVEDPRIAESVLDGKRATGAAYVRFVNNPRIYDSRETFWLDRGFDLLDES